MTDKPRKDADATPDDDAPFDASTIVTRRDPAAMAAHNDPRFSQEAINERRRGAGGGHCCWSRD
jgi:hypothetical protein